MRLSPPKNKTPVFIAVFMIFGLVACGPSAERVYELPLTVDGKADSLFLRTLTVDIPPKQGGRYGSALVELTGAKGLFRAKTEGVDEKASLQLAQIANQSVIKVGRASDLPRLRFKLGAASRYALQLRNHGSASVQVTLQIETDSQTEPVRLVFNQPDCLDCEDRSGGLRHEISEAIRWAEKTIDVAVYGLRQDATQDRDDPVAALCQAAEEGVTVRLIADDEFERSGSSYFESIFSDEGGLENCGVHIEVVRSSKIMHHKFLLIDRGRKNATLITGSTNFTPTGFTANHNHMYFLAAHTALFDSFYDEFEQLWGHCRAPRLEGSRRCSAYPNNECTSACTQDLNEEGPWQLGEHRVSAYFTPGDDPLSVLRGSAKEKKYTAVPAECLGESDHCVCRQSGSKFLCSFCGGSEPGVAPPRTEDLNWGLIGKAKEKVLVDMYAGTDQCLALGLSHLHRKGIEVAAVWDRVNSSSTQNRNRYLCGYGIPVYVSNWGGDSQMVRNHNKTVLIDETVFDGSLNVTKASQDNNESVLIWESASIARQIEDYIRSEIALLRSTGVTPGDAASCRCADLVDNDGDGLLDAEDGDCDLPQ